MGSIIDYALKNRAAVLVLILMILAVGTRSYLTLPREAQPDVSVPFAIVTTVYYGTSPEDMESQITDKLESKLGEIQEIKEMRSLSGDGVSSISVEFEADADVDEMLTKLREKVDLAKSELPVDAEEPMVTEISFSDFPVLLVNVTSDYDPALLKEVAEDIQDELKTVPGVLDVKVSGGLEREVQVNIDPEKLRHYRVSLFDVQGAIQSENLNVPGGAMEVGTYNYLLRVPGEIEDPLSLGDFVVKSAPNPIYLRDVAEVRYTYKDRASTARMERRECVTISITKRTGENLIRIVDEARSRMDKLLPGLPPTTRVTFTSDASADIKSMVHELENEIINALVLVIAVLIFFLGLRTSLIAATAIPLSMLLGMIVLEGMGYTLNMIVLFSLILVLGMLVDDAIVVVENIYRFVQDGHKPFRAASKATKEVAWPVTGGTMTMIVAFLPLAFWPGIMGEFMKYLPITMMIMLLASLVVGVTINPTITGWLMRVKSDKGAHGREGIGADSRDLAFANAYRRVLEWALCHRLTVVAGAHVALFLILILFGAFGTGLEFFPTGDPKKVFVDFELPSGSRLENTDSYVQRVEENMAKYPDVRTYVAQSGVSISEFDFGMGGGGPANKARVSIDMKDREDRQRPSTETMADLRASLKDVTGADVVVQKMEEGPPTGKPVTIEISGEDFAVLGKVADQLLDTIKVVPGLVNLQSDYDQGKPEIQIHVDRERAAYLGVNTAQIGMAVRTAFYGSQTGSFREGDEDVDITVRFAEEHRRSIEDVENLNLLTHDGNLVPLSSVARVEMTTGLGGISHVDQDRVVTVTADVEGRLANDALNDVKAMLKGYSLPQGYSLAFAGQDDEQNAAMAFLSKAFAIAIFLIGLVLVTQFKSITTPLIILFTVVLSLGGVFLGLLVTRMPFGIIMTGIGVISLSGTVVRNAIVLLDYTLLLRERGLAKTEAIVQAGMVRLRPVLLTAACMVLGMMPMALGISFDFRAFRFQGATDSTEWWQGLAIAVVFGLSVATVLTLVVVPVLYSLVDGFTARMRARFGGLVNQE